MLIYIMLGACVILLNILDDVTTRIGLHKLPEGMRGNEGNPLMAYLMEKDYTLSTIVKQLGIFLIVAILVYANRDEALVFLIIAFGLVVISNTWAIVWTLVKKKKKQSLFGLIMSIPKIPKIISLLVVYALILGLSDIFSKMISGILR